MSKPILQVSNLYKIYKGTNVPAVNMLNLEIGSKEIYGLLGANGAGKTTTISMLSGIIQYDKGKIIIDSKEISTDYEAIKPLIGVVPQELALYDNLTPEENLFFIGRMYNINKTELKDKISFLLEKFDLTQHKKKKVGDLSGGMKRKVNLLAGILHTPKLLFLDEPTVGIDIHSKKMIIDFLKELRSEGMSILYTSHNMAEAEALCDQISIINKGEILMKGKPNTLIKEHQFNTLEELLLNLPS